MEVKKPTAEQMAKFKKNAQDQSLSAEVRAKFQAIVDKFSEDVKDVEDKIEGKSEPKKRVGRKPSTPKATKKPSTPRGTKKTATDIEQAKAEIKAKTGKTEEECEAIIEQYRALRTKAQEGKRKAEQASADNKKRVEKLDNKGDLIEGTNVKTADAVIESTAKDVAEKIEQQIEAVEEKAEKEAKAEVAKDNTIKTPKDKKEAIKEKVDDKVKKETKVVVERVVIDTSALLTSIATTLGKFDKDSQKEFLIKLRSDIDKLLAKYAFGGMTDGATQVMNIQQSNLSASSVNPTMFAKGGITEDDAISLNYIALMNGIRKSENTFEQFKRKLTEVIKRNDYRMPTAKAFEIAYEKNQFATGGGVSYIKNWEVVGINKYGKMFKERITLGRMSDKEDVKNALRRRTDLNIREVTSIKEVFAKGGGVEDEELHYWEVSLKMPNGEIVYESVIADSKEDAEYYGELTDSANEGGKVLSVKSMGKEKYDKGGGVKGIGEIEKFFEDDNKKSVNAKSGELVYVNKLYSNGKLTLQRMLSKEIVLKSIERSIEKRNPIIKIIPQGDVYNSKEFNGDILEITYEGNNIRDTYEKVSIYANGGVVGQEIVFDYNGEENTGVIKEITNLGDYVVRADNGRTLLAQRDMDVISLGAMRQQGVEQRKKRFGFFEDGGEIEEKGLYPIKNFTKVVNHFNSGDQWDLEEYPPYSGKGTIKEWMGEYPTDLEDAKAFIFESHPDWASEYEEEINDAKDNEELQDILYENDCPLFKMDNTYNSDWWGGVIQTGVLQADEDGYSGALVFVQFHRGGDVRGNYGEVQAFILNSFYEDFPLFASNLTYTIETNRGDVILDTQDFEGYTLLVVEDATGNFEEGEDVTLDELSKTFDLRGYSLYARGGGIKGVIVYDNNGETFDRYTIFTPDGSVYGMSDNALMPNGFNQYLGDETEVEKGSHLGKRLKAVPESIKVAVERRMSEEYAKGGMTEHGLRVGDRIWGESKDLNQVFVKNNDEWKTIDLDKGLRYAKGGKLWIDTKGKGGLKGVKPSRKNTFRNEAVKRGLTSGQLASKVLASPSRYKGINPRSAQLVKNMGVRKKGGSIGDILRNRRGE